MIIHFNKKKVQRLVDATVAAETCHVLYTGEAWGCPEDTSKGLNLVGDDGVYLMSNRVAPDNHSNVLRGGSPDNVVYADEIDPRKGDCWHAKDAAFGGSDGAEFLDLASVQRWIALTDGPRLRMNLSESTMSMEFDRPATDKPASVHEATVAGFGYYASKLLVTASDDSIFLAIRELGARLGLLTRLHKRIALPFAVKMKPRPWAPDRADTWAAVGRVFLNELGKAVAPPRERFRRMKEAVKQMTP